MSDRPVNKEGIKEVLTEALLSDEPFEVDKVVERIAKVPPAPPVPYASRTFWHTSWKQGHNTYDGTTQVEVLEQVKTRAEADFYGSKCESGQHAPMFDVDYGAELIPSSTPGHYHLYLHKEVSWRKFRKVLKTMAKAGLIETGWYDLARKRRMAVLRLPEVSKSSPSQKLPLHPYQSRPSKVRTRTTKK